MSVKYKKVEQNSEINKLLYRTFTSDLRPAYIEVGEENIVLPVCYEVIADEIDNFKVYDSDIFVASHPKAGTTWTQEMVWMIINDNDFEKGKVSLEERFPFLELKCIFDYRGVEKENPHFEHADFMDSVKYIANLKTHPRFIKTHLPWSLLPKQIRKNEKKPKIIHVYRNPKDVCISFYHHSVFIERYTGTLEEFCELFLAGKMSWSPFWKNVLGYWNKRHEENVLFITYEDMKQDLASVIRKVAKFLGKELDEEKLPALIQHLSFESMKKNESVNGEDEIRKRDLQGSFMRKGIVGSYKEEMSPEMIDKFDAWVKQHRKNTDFTL